MKNVNVVTGLLIVALLAVSPRAVGAQEKAEGAEGQSTARRTIGDADKAIQEKLARSLEDLAALRRQVSDQRIPLAKQLSKLDAELVEQQQLYEQVGRELADKSQGLSNLSGEIQELREESSFLASLLTDYNREFDSRLHIAEKHRYRDQLKKVQLLLEDSNATEGDKLISQVDVVDRSIGKIDEAIGGVRFEGNAVADGVLKPGRFVLVGPTALFASVDAQDVGAARLGAAEEPIIMPYGKQEDRVAAASLVVGTGGSFPLDVTLGNALKVESIEETWWEHVQKGGPIMIPMAVLAGASLLVVLIKWLTMLLVRRPTKKQMAALLECIDNDDYKAAVEVARSMPGPAGRMLEAGANHLGEPRDLVEEVMFEQMLSARLRLQGWLPFVAICATSAPLLGLLGTVTGIMGTFALMTEFGAGNPQILSSGISEALVTTENGLIVAIPSLLLHAFLSRKARGLVDGMEKMAMQVLNRVRTPLAAA